MDHGAWPATIRRGNYSRTLSLRLRPQHGTRGLRNPLRGPAADGRAHPKGSPASGPPKADNLCATKPDSSICYQQGIKPAIFDSIINKTPLSFRTNRIIGGVAPSEYLARLEKGDKENPPIERQRLDGYLRSHLIDPELLRRDDFETFMTDRQKRLLGLIEQATGKAAYTGDAAEEGLDVDADEDTLEAEMIMPG